MATINDTIVMLKAVEQMPKVPTFLWDTLVEDQGTVGEGEVMWDYRRGDQQMAPFVTDNVGGVALERTGFVTRTIDFPTIAPERIIEKSQIMTRAFGEAVYGGKTPEKRAQEMRAADLQYLKRAIQLTREWMVAQVLTTGKLTLPTFTEHGQVNAQKVADYQFTNYATVTNKWDGANADIDADLDAMFEEIVDNMGPEPDMFIMSPDVAHAMLNNDKFLKKRDIIRVDYSRVNPQHRENRYPGMMHIGFTNDGKELIAYRGQYKDWDGQMKPFIPAKTIYAVSRGIFKALHGPVTLIEKDGEPFKTYIAKEVPYFNSYAQNNTQVIRLTSRPIVIPFNVGAWSKRTVLS